MATKAEQTINQDRIIQDPGVLVGKPTVRGTRIPVQLVLAKLAHNPDLRELFADYPRQTVEDVKACVEYGRASVEKKDQAARRRIIAQQIPRPANDVRFLLDESAELRISRSSASTLDMRPALRDS